MSLDRHTRCGEEIDGLPRAFASGYLASEHPITSADRLKVFLFHPAFGLLGMSPLRPLPQSPKDRVVHFRQGLLAAHIPVIVGPAPDDRVELHNQVYGSGLAARLDDGSDFGQERRHILAVNLIVQLGILDAAKRSTVCLVPSRPVTSPRNTQLRPPTD